VTNAGLDIITNKLKAAGTEPLNIGWGTGAGTAAVADTTLFAEKLVDLVGVLEAQHKAGRRVTEQILTTAKASGLLRDESAKKELTRQIRAFIRMYEPHEALVSQPNTPNVIPSVVEILTSVTQHTDRI